MDMQYIHSYSCTYTSVLIHTYTHTHFKTQKFIIWLGIMNYCIHKLVTTVIRGGSRILCKGGKPNSESLKLGDAFFIYYRLFGF